MPLYVSVNICCPVGGDGCVGVAMAGELRSRTCLWIGAGSIALGVGAALAGGSGVAHADATSKGLSSASSPAKHQAVPASRTHSDTRSAVKPASEKKTE